MTTPEPPGSLPTEPHEPSAASFVIRLWLDNLGEIGWHGQITHVQSGRQRPVRSLRQITEFIARTLDEVEPPGARHGRIRHWLHR